MAPLDPPLRPHAAQGLVSAGSRRAAWLADSPMGRPRRAGMPPFRPAATPLPPPLVESTPLMTNRRASKGAVECPLRALPPRCVVARVRRRKRSGEPAAATADIQRAAAPRQRMARAYGSIIHALHHRRVERPRAARLRLRHESTFHTAYMRPASHRQR